MGRGEVRCQVLGARSRTQLWSARPHLVYRCPVVRLELVVRRCRGVLLTTSGTRIATAMERGLLKRRRCDRNALEPLLQVLAPSRLRHDAGKLRQALRQSLDHASKAA